MRAIRPKSKALIAGVFGASALVFAACDNAGERTERVQDLADAAMEQLSGEGGAPAESAMERASLSERALAGVIQEEAEFVPATARTSRFAVGSIIAKPREIAIEEPMALRSEPAPMAAPPRLELDPTESKEAAEEDAQRKTKAVIESIEKLEIEPLSSKRGLGLLPNDSAQASEETAAAPAPRSVEAPEEAPAADAAASPEILERERKLARRAIPTTRTITSQTDARSKMLDTMSKYGLAGSVELSTSGQMVIQIGEDGADPTQGAPDEETDDERPRLAPPNARSLTAVAAMPVLAANMGDDCPEDITPEEVRGNPIMATNCVVKELRQTGEFAYVEKDFIFDHQFARRPRGPVVTATATPNDPLYDLQWHFKKNGATAGQSRGGAGFADFWDRQANQGSTEVVVAVVDTGLELGHPDIQNSANVVAGWDMVSDPRTGNDGDGRDPDPNDPGDLCDPSNPLDSDSYHGTHVAGTIGAAASNNGAGVAGGAWTVKIVPVRALGRCGGRLSDINDGIRWAGGLIPAFDENGDEVWNENPADIINLSIGLFEFCPASMQDAIDAVTERGAIVVSAAGNDRVSTEFYAPGGCNNVISVAASDGRGQITPYSNYGAEVDIIAPGGDLTRDDDGDGRPDGVLSTKTASNCVDPVTNQAVAGCFYAYEQGTSMAAPHVSAALALIKSKFPAKSAEELEASLLRAVDPRAPNQCAGACTSYPDTDPIPGSNGLCSRPCGAGLLNLERLSESE